MSKTSLKQQYFNVSKPGSFSSSGKLFHALKSTGQPVKQNQINEWLMTQDPYTLHRKALKKFKRNKVFAQGIDSIWQIDLVDLSKLSKYNNKYK